MRNAKRDVRLVSLREIYVKGQVRAELTRACSDDHQGTEVLPSLKEYKVTCLHLSSRAARVVQERRLKLDVPRGTRRALRRPLARSVSAVEREIRHRLSARLTRDNTERVEPRGKRRERTNRRKIKEEEEELWFHQRVFFVKAPPISPSNTRQRASETHSGLVAGPRPKQRRDCTQSHTLPQ
ncbi:unnamed protein product [Pleuronectes platessa]|uniref:Uncharacterized protein n=1 Tax=Pleuronectes platessa TaxID=8262 RepID=A0A9N7U0U8_PLEPL|nr:unnamed protein product [Pleuronectes platessa]